MSITRKIAVGGIASLVAITGVATAPLAVAGATSLESIKEPQKLQLKTDSNSKMDVATDVDCSSHTLTARVTNKTSATIHPDVTFNDEQMKAPAPPINPGMTGNFVYDFSGNYLMVDVKVQSDSAGTIESSPLLNCLEPVSFKVTDWSDSAVVGELQNNSTLVPQTVYTQVNSGDVRLETLEPGETRLVAMPFKPYVQQTAAFVRIATAAGYESSYLVDLEKVPLPPVPVPALK